MIGGVPRSAKPNSQNCTPEVEILLCGLFDGIEQAKATRRQRRLQKEFRTSKLTS
jgi:hypothetical protein